MTTPNRRTQELQGGSASAGPLLRSDPTADALRMAESARAALVTALRVGELQQAVIDGLIEELVRTRRGGGMYEADAREAVTALVAAIVASEHERLHSGSPDNPS